jgi:Ca-activated chloride channel family protein
MSFIWPVMLFSLVLIPPAVVLYLRLQQRRLRAVSFGALGLAGGAARRQFGVRRHLPPAIFLAGLTIMLFALARPQAVVSLPKQEGIVILAFDVSGSMAADDLEPTRMEAAKAAATEFAQRQPPSVEIGIVAFSDSGFSVQAPTNNQEAILAAIRRLRPQRGTSLGQGILTALNTIAIADAAQAPSLYTSLTPAPTAEPTPVPDGSHTSAVIVLLSDGENNENPDPVAVAQVAADRGVRIFTVGIGSPAGARLEVEGFTVQTQLNEMLLREISQLTDGAYYNAASPDDLRAIYDKIDPELVIEPEEMELTSLLAGAGILTLLIGGALSLWWFSRMP